MIAEEKLIYYNKVLAEQNVKLRDEIQATEMSFRLRFGMPPGLLHEIELACFF